MDTFNVELPDGRVLEGVPVGTTRAQIEAKLGKIQEAPAPAKPISPAAEFGKVADKTLRGGALALPGMIGDAAMWSAQKLREGAATAYNKVGEKTGAYVPDATLPEPVRMWPSDALAEITGGPIGKPETGIGKTIAGVGEATVGTMMGAGPASKLKQLATLGAASGLGAEAAARVFDDNPVVRAAGGLAAGLPVGIAQAYKGNNTAKVAREVFSGISDDELESAIKTAAKAKAAGLDLMPNQALGRESNLDALVSALATSKEGKNTISALRSQPLQIQQEMEILKRGLPGETRALRDINNRGQEVATAVIEDAKARRTAKWGKDLEEAAAVSTEKEVPGAIMKKVDDKLTRLAEANGNPAIKASLLKLRDGMVMEDGYITEPEKLNELLKYAASQTKPVNMQTTGLDAGASKYVNGIISKLRDDFGPAFSPIQKANAGYAANTEVSGLKKSVIGEIAGRTGAQADVNAPKGKIFSVFDAGTHPDATRSEILTMQAGLAKSDPTIFTDAAKTWLSDKISDALAGKGARPAANAATKLTDVLGSPQAASAGSATLKEASAKAQGLKEVLVGMARSEKLPDETYLALPKFLNYVALAAERPSSTGGITGQGISELAKSSIFGRMGQVSVMTPLRQPIIAYVERLGSNTKAELDRLLTTPEGLRMLHTLSKTSPRSDTGRKAIELFLSTNAAAQSGTELSPDINQ